MKRCPTCQRTYAEDSITSCLDDGTQLLSVEAGAGDAPPNLGIPGPRVTGQPMQPYQPAQPYYAQPRTPGFKLSRILGISGAVLLLLGTFMPIISFSEGISFNLYTFILGLIPAHGAAPDAESTLPLFLAAAIVLPLSGIVSLIFALVNRLKTLIVTGLITLGALVAIFLKLRSLFSEVRGDLRAEVGIGWGMYVMAIGAIILIVAGVMKSSAPAVNPGWGAPPPPYPPAR